MRGRAAGRGLGGGGLAGQVGVCGCGRRLGAVSGGGANSAPALLMAARWPGPSDVVVGRPAGLGADREETVEAGVLGPRIVRSLPLERSAKARRGRRPPRGTLGTSLL